MKKLLLIFAVILTMFSCKKDDVPTQAADVVGRWNVTHMWNAEKNDWHDVSSQGIYAEFKADNTYKASDGSGTYTVAGNVATCKVGTTTVTYDFAITGNNAVATVTVGSSNPYKVKAVRQ